MISDKKLNNTIFLMDMILQLYIDKHKISIEEFLNIDKKSGILHFIKTCPEVFDGLPNEEILKEAEEFINEKISR